MNPDDSDEIQRALTEIHALRGKYPLNRDWEAVRRYERPRLAAEYARLIQETSRVEA